MDELRWILLGLGVLIIAGVYGYARLQDWRRDGPPWRGRRSAHREPFSEYSEPALDDEDPLSGDPLADDGSDDGIVGPSRVVGGASSVPPSPAEPSPAAGASPSAPASPTDDDGSLRGRAVGEEKIIALSVMAPAEQPYNGAAVAEVLAADGLQLTHQGVFQRTLDTAEGPVALFTVANIVEPGIFDVRDPAATMTPGVVLILQLPAPFDGLGAFELMLGSARRLAQSLGGQLLDGRRCDLTTQAIEHLRAELLEYRRRGRLAERRQDGAS
jgi:cell division protein ZipA